jgi:hypothetical protein
MMRSYCALAVVVIVTVMAESSTCAQGRFGIGFVVGEPTGVSWKYRMDNGRAVDGALGFSPFDRYRVHVDYLWHSLPFNERNLQLHYGIGGAIGFGRTEYVVISGRRAYLFRNQDVGLGVRGVVGLTYNIPRSPLDVFVELAPMMILAPGTGLGFDGGLGVRIYP